MTKLYVLIWNPKRWQWPDFDDVVDETAAGFVVDEPWTVIDRKDPIQPGDLAILLRQAVDPGIVASGTFISSAEAAPNWEDPTTITMSAHIRWHTILHTHDRLSRDDLEYLVPGIKWKRLQGSGYLVPSHSAELLLATWDRHRDSLLIHSPGEISDLDRVPEGAVTKVLVNSYERSPVARSRCIAAWGTTCNNFNFNFEARYGDLGRGSIHIHHLRELASVGGDHDVDPVADLRPVCPNCHAMLHRRKPAYTIEELRVRLHARGTTSGEGSWIVPDDRETTEWKAGRS